MTAISWNDDNLTILYQDKDNGYSYRDTAIKLGTTYDACKKAYCVHKQRIEELRSVNGSGGKVNPALTKRLDARIPSAAIEAKTDSVVIASGERKYGIQRDITEIKRKIKGIAPLESKNGNVLVIGDTHIPFEREGYLEHCQRVRDKYDCQTIVHVGDEVDNHAISYHEHDPDGYSAGHEILVAYARLQKWIKVFPEMYICEGNHTLLPLRKAKTAGLPRAYIKTYNELWDAPESWHWQYQWEIDEVIYTHGMGSGGANGHRARAEKNRQSTVIGHVHSYAGAAYLASNKDLIFGMNVGCGIDIKTYGMEYGKDFATRPTISCGVVLDYGRIAIVEPMSI